jgi:hypothetical protein
MVNSKSVDLPLRELLLARDRVRSESKSRNESPARRSRAAPRRRSDAWIAAARLLAILGLVGPAIGQALNVDVGDNPLPADIPSSALGAAAAQAGVWNPVSAYPGTTPLVGLGGAATGASITCIGAGYPLDFDNAGTSGDDEKLMDDFSDPTPSSTWRIDGLAPGNYRLFTYAWAPDSSAYLSNVDVLGSVDAAQVVGGAWPAGYALGVTHAVHHVSIASGSSIIVTISVWTGYASVNGFQVVPDAVGTSFCVPGGGVMACACGNPNGAGVGCANTGSAGASLSAAGSASLAADAVDPGSVALTGTDMLAGQTCIFLQGDALLASGTTFGAGIRCADGLLFRLYTKSILGLGGTKTAPEASDRSISNRSADLGTAIASGATRYYQAYYRDPTLANPGGSCPSNATFNISSGRILTWGP